jgi:2'-5' RNA ligase
MGVERLFVGIALPEEAREALARHLCGHAVRQLAPPGVRLLPADNWHVTLQFLGDVASETSAALHAACSRAAAAVPEFALELAGASAFPSPRRARTLFVAVTRGQAELTQLAQRLGEETEPLGFARDPRPFHGHVTFARQKHGSAAPLLAACAPPALEIRVTRLTLFRSLLSSQGSRYEVVAAFPLPPVLDGMTQP